jgi:hypothetical protein
LRTERFSQTTGAIWSMVIGTICGIPILLFILKEKCFKGLNTLFLSKRHKIMPLLFNPPAGYILISQLMLSIFLFAKNQ